MKYVLVLLEETGMNGCRRSDTPMDPNLEWSGDSKGIPVDKGRYLTYTPDIAFVVSVVNQFIHSPYEEHPEVVYKTLEYLNNTPGKGLLFNKDNQRNIEAFIDTD